MSFDSSKINLTNIDIDNKNKLLKSVQQQLNLSNPQLYYPSYADFFEEYNINETLEPDTNLSNFVIDSKYICTEIICRIDEFDDSDNEDNENNEDNEDNEDNENDSINSVNSDDNNNNNDNNTKNNNDNNTKNNLDNQNIMETDLTEEDEIKLGLMNTYAIVGKVQKKKQVNDEEVVSEYSQKIFIKKSPLLEPIKIILDQYEMDSLSNMLPNNNYSNTINKINSSNNSSHVEALFLYLGNKLVEMGKCPTFPYYYGCINAIDNNFYYNIDEEYDNIKDEDWFLDKIENNLELIEIDIDEDSTTESSLNTSLRDSDIDNLEKLLKDINMEHDLDNDDENNNQCTDSQDSDSQDSNSQYSDSQDSDSQDSNYDEPKITEIDDDEATVQLSNNMNNSDFIEELDIDDNELDNVMDMNTTYFNNKRFNNLDISDNLVDLDTSINESILDNLHMKTRHKLEASDINTINNSYQEKIEELNIDEEFDNMSLSDFKTSRKSRFVKFDNVPINLCLMEHMNQTLDDLLDNEYPISTTEWFSILFQVIFGLAVAQKHFYFVHNDLHSSNIMFQNTKEKFLYFFINRNYYKIPTYNKITKIIDFARGTFKLGDKWVFSDVFHPEGEAAGQYDYPEGTTLKNCKVKPNPSFDMIRLISTIKERLIDFPEVMLMVSEWTVNDDEHNILNDDDDFDLYIEIAHNCHRAVPLNIIKHENFKQFRVRAEHIPKNKFIYFF
jgi:hypothetical protein